MLDRMLLSAGGEEKLHVEDVFSTYLYTSNNQTITNGIDLAGKGGMVWIKNRTYTENHLLFDTARGALKAMSSNLTDEAFTLANSLTAFNSNGFSIGSGAPGPNSASWTFRKAAKFFDVVTFTGNGTSRNIAHSLGVKPGFITVKRTDGSGNWFCWARVSDTQVARNTSTTAFALNNTQAATVTNDSTYVNLATAATFDPQYMDEFGFANASGATYVAYLFAHDPSVDGIIQCGSYTGNGSTAGPQINLGWEPQWVLVKNAARDGYGWYMHDNMRRMPVGAVGLALLANTPAAEVNSNILYPSSTGFNLVNTSASHNANGDTYVYIAIRRGPMKTPTVGTSVFAPVLRTGTGSTATITAGFPVDLIADTNPPKTRFGLTAWRDRLRGPSVFSSSTNTSAEYSDSDGVLGYDSNVGVRVGADTSWLGVNESGTSYVNWMFRRAPGFFDVVCYTGNGGAGRTVNHNLGVAPELMIVKKRDTAVNWVVYNSSLGNSNFLILNQNNAVNGAVYWNNTDPTSTQFTLGSSSATNGSGGTYVAYLFASCPGVSKVGSYTGNGSSQTINCGFSSGARFFLVKRTDSTGDWWVYDSARGIVAAADPALRLNSTAAEVTSADAVDTDSTGIIVNQEATCNINVNGATYIYLAIA